MMDRARVLDMLLARHLFGCEVFEEVNDDGSRPLRRRYIDKDRTSWVAERLELYSSTYSGMGLVIEQMRADGSYLELHDQGDTIYARFTGPEAAGRFAETLPAAVAEAALKALGVEVPDGVA